MSYILSADRFARYYADSQLAEAPPLPEERSAIVRRRHVYDFKVRASNAMAVWTIASLVAALLFYSPTALFFAWVGNQIRSSIALRIENSAPCLAFLQHQVEDALLPPVMQRIAQARAQAALNYGFENPNWSPVQVQILDLKLWFNPLPPLNPQ